MTSWRWIIDAPILCDLYCRVSTSEQAEEGYSLAEQESRLRAFAVAQGWVVNDCRIDPGFSGAKLDRPGLQAVIADCKARKIQRVVTYKLDRLSRSQKDTLHLIEDVFIPNGVAYVSMTESLDTGSAFGMAMIGILSVFAQLERETIKERMALGRAAAIREGSWRGGDSVPIGYRYQPSASGGSAGTIVPDPLEAAAVRRIFELFLQGNSYRATLTRVREEIPLPGRGQSNKGSWVSAILTNRTYIGQMRFRGEWYPGTFEPIIDEGTFWAAQKRVASYQEDLDRKILAPRHRGHLLTGFLFCGCCGARCCHKRVQYRQRKTGELSTYESYVCYAKQQRGSDCPSSRQLKAVDLEEAVLSQLEAVTFDQLGQAGSGSAEEIVALEAKLAGISKQQERLVELFTVGGIPIEVIQKQSQALTDERAKLEDRIDVLRMSDDARELEELREAVDAAATIRGMTEEEQRDIMRILIDRITVYPDQRVVIDWKV